MRAAASGLLISLTLGACAADFTVDLPDGSGGLPFPQQRLPGGGTPEPTETPLLEGMTTNGDIAVGAYTGNGQPIVISVGFAPVFVLVQLENGEDITGDDSGVIRVKGMSGSKRASSIDPASGGMITSLTSNGFTVDSGLLTNGSACGGEACRYHFVAIADATTVGKAGSYTGNGSSSVSAYPPGAVYRPGSAILLPDGPGPVTVRTEEFGAAGAQRIDGAGYEQERLTGLSVNPDGGISAGQDALANFAVHHFASFAELTDRIATGTYTGNGTDATAISVPFEPDAVLVQHASAAGPMFLRTTYMPPNVSVTLAGVGKATAIKDLTSGGFVLGTLSDVNANGAPYYFIALRSADD